MHRLCAVAVSLALFQSLPPCSSSVALWGVFEVELELRGGRCGPPSPLRPTWNETFCLSQPRKMTHLQHRQNRCVCRGIISRAMETPLSKEILPYSLLLLSDCSHHGCQIPQHSGPTPLTISLTSSSLLMPFSATQNHICLFEHT